MAYPLYSDEYFMNEALKEAKLAFEKDEVPIGAVVVSRNRIIARGYNMTEHLTDITAHAEMIVITSAANFLGSKYLDDCSIFVTVEPCVMCAGAISLSRPARLVYGASEPKTGFTRLKESILYNKTSLTAGVLEQECSLLMTDFFKRKRT